MKNFTNNFKQFTSHLSARWLIMTLMLLVGTSSAWAATQRYIYVGLSNNYHNYKTANEWGINQWGGTNGGVISGSSIEDLETTITYDNCTFHMYRMYIYDDNKNFEFKGNNNWWDCKKENASAISGTTKNAILFQDNDGGDGGSPTFHQTDYQETSTASLTASATPVNTNTNVALSPSLSSNETYNEIKSTSYSISPSTGASISNNTFKATVAGTYTVTATVTYNPKYFTDITKTATATTTIEVTDPYTYPAVSTISATVDGDNLVCEGKITNMGSAAKVVWAFTVLSTDAISKAHSDWKYPDGQNQITTANTDFEYSIPISSLSLTSGTKYYVRAMAVDLNNLGWADNQYGNAVAGDAVSFVYNPCIELPDDAYTLSSSSAEWTGNDITPTISKKDENYPTPTITYNVGSTLPNKPREYTIKGTVSGDATYCNKEFDLGTFTITCPTIAAPAITTSATVCAGTEVTLSSYNGNNTNTVKWYSNSACNEEVTEQITPINNEVYYAKAYHEESGCYSSEYSTLTFRVNPLPIITISGSETAVLYEDVTLTATATDGATVKWYEGGVEKAEGTTYVVTSATEPSKTVTAKAFLNGCESAEASHPVTFSAEDCNSVESKDIIINFTHPAQNTNGYPKCQYWGFGTLTYKINGVSNSKDLGSGTSGTKTITIENISASTITDVKFTAYHSYGDCKAYTKTITLDRGYEYNVTINPGTNAGQQSSQSAEKELVTTSKTDLSSYPDITDPAAKTISVSTTEGEGNIIFSGQVVKTGCDATNEYGFQYSSDEQTWTTVKVGENAAAGTAISNNTVKGLDGTYYVRAYITNDNSTQYGAVTEITVSTTKTPISNVTLNYCDENGENVGVDPKPMCKGATAYVKLEHAGSNYSDIKWLVEGVETNLVTDKGNGVWSYIIQGTGHLSVELRNDANKDNEDNPTWATSDKLSFTMKEEPVAPYISINPASGVICQGSSATIKVENPSTACSYKLVEGDTETGFTKYESGDLKYTVQNVGKYYVVALHDACTDNEYTSNQVAINQIISTSAKISIEPKNQETTPWEPVNIIVTADEGYVYEVTYTGNNLQDVDGVIIKQKGDTYTYYIPRPTGWGEGNAVSVRTPVAYGIKAQLKVDGEANQCNLSFDTATITVKDEKDEDCD